MLSNLVLTTATLFFFTIQCEFIQQENTNSKQEHDHDNCSDVHSGHSEYIGVSDTSRGNNEYENESHYHEHEIRFIRSDNLSTSFNGSGVERPNPRLVINKTLTYKKAREQFHVFFSDKAREDAYQKTEASAHPYSVVFIVHTRDGGLTVCSGTLMTASLILTAAHCVVDLPTEKIEVFAGITINIFSEAIPHPLPEGSQMRTTRRFYPHPKYDAIAPNVDYDIALVKVNPEFEITEYVKPVEISSTPWNHTGVRQCVLTAFGSVRDEPNSSPDDFIRKTQTLQVEKPCYCDTKLKRSMGIGATSRYICMRPRQDFGICAGDSGGGIMCDGKLTAVVSSSANLSPFYPCNRHARIVRSEFDFNPKCGDKNTLSIFQDVYSYFTWIEKSAAYSHGDNTNGTTGNVVNLYSCLGVLFLTSMTLIRYYLYSI